MKYFIRNAALGAAFTMFGLTAVSAAVSSQNLDQMVQFNLAKINVDTVNGSVIDTLAQKGTFPAAKNEPGMIGMYYGTYAGAKATDATHDYYFFELYQNAKAYDAHKAGQAFKDYIAGTQGMINSKSIDFANPALVKVRMDQPGKVMDLSIIMAPDSDHLQAVLDYQIVQAKKTYGNHPDDVVGTIVAVDKTKPVVYVWTVYRDQVSYGNAIADRHLTDVDMDPKAVPSKINTIPMLVSGDSIVFTHDFENRYRGQ